MQDERQLTICISGAEHPRDALVRLETIGGFAVCEYGFYKKFNIERTDGRSSKGEKHSNCRYFVIDLDHDRHAIKMLMAYAKLCRSDNPKLSDDLRAIAYGLDVHKA